MCRAHSSEALAVLVFVVVVICACSSSVVYSGSAPAWLLPGQARDSRLTLPVELEREASLASPVQVGAARFASQLFNGRLPYEPDDQLQLQQLKQMDLFQCIDPTRQLFEQFLRQYNRTFNGDNLDKLDRLNLFMTTLRRTIMLNRIIQNEILNQSNYDLKPEIRNYHFISPTGSAENIALWYADITDCELGLIKYIIFDIFYLLDKNEPEMAYKVALDNSEYLPLLSEDGFEQLANILLVRLYDRFKGDEKMNQLFQWPLYVKKLAGYVYNRRQMSEPQFNAKLALITYAYPSYFKDLKYNAPAVNRTGDNWRAHLDHEKFNKLLGRKFVNRQERNKRLAIFRQRWTLVNLLNDEDNKRWQNATTQPDWLRVQYHKADDLVSPGGQPGVVSEKLRAEGSGGETDPLSSPEIGSGGRFKHTQFSDLTDTEFVAFLTNDFSMLENSKESADFLDANFPIRQLDDRFKAELAAELELRRSIQLAATQSASLLGQHSKQVTSDRSAPNHNQQAVRETLALARRVVEELISDVGLPIGSVMVGDVPEEEHYSVFNKISTLFGKSYASGRSSASAAASLRNARLQSQQQYLAEQPNETELSDERQRRYEQFKLNYGRFKAWWIKEGWKLDGSQLVAMLRLADMSWQEIKLSLFKICCLTDDNLASLGAKNATIQYLGSNEFVCQQMDNPDNTNINIGSSAADQQQQQQARELAALELYYYYTVHFNKHHSDMDSFNERFAIFKHNIDQIRRHSCTRGLTLYRSLKLKKLDTLSTIDVLDPRRSYTDDINLDRYKYFTVPNLRDPAAANQQQQQDDSLRGFDARLRAAEERRNRQQQYRDGGGSSSLSRAGISYRRDSFFSSLLDRPEPLRANYPQRSPDTSYADKLTSAAQNVNLYSEKYRRNSVGRIYELVMQRYRYCMRTVRNIELGANELQQQCQSSGPLGDQAANGPTSGWSSDNQLSSAVNLQLQLQQQDQCAFYRLGLEPWAEGLIKQDLLSAQLIQSAKC